MYCFYKTVFFPLSFEIFPQVWYLRHSELGMWLIPSFPFKAPFNNLSPLAVSIALAPFSLPSLSLWKRVMTGRWKGSLTNERRRERYRSIRQVFLVPETREQWGCSEVDFHCLRSVGKKSWSRSCCLRSINGTKHFSQISVLSLRFKTSGLWTSLLT